MTASLADKPRRGDQAPPPLVVAGLTISFLILAAIARYPAFFMSVVDWDESLYFLMAEGWRNGHLPYTTLWDNKPIGIYAIFAVFQSTFSGNIISIRIAQVVFTTLTGLILFYLSKALDNGPSRSGIIFYAFPGFLYVLLSVQEGGLAANTELFMAPMETLAVYLALLSSGKGRAWLFTVGCAVGIACMIKYVAVFEAPVPFLLLLARLNRGEAKGQSRMNAVADLLGVLVFFALGALTAFVITFLSYWIAGHLGEFIDASLLSNVRRLQVPVSTGFALRSILDVVRTWPVAVLGSFVTIGLGIRSAAIWARYKDRQASDVEAVILTAWLATTVIGICSAKSFYPHYFLQALPPMCLATGMVLRRSLSLDSALATGRHALLLLFISIQPVITAKDQADKFMARLGPASSTKFKLLRDTPAAIAEAIREDAPDMVERSVFVFDYQPIIYSLAAAAPPTKYAFPPFLIEQKFSAVANLDPLAELRSIMVERPRYIVRATSKEPDANPAAYAIVDAALLSDYEIWKSFKEASVYRLRHVATP